MASSPIRDKIREFLKQNEVSFRELHHEPTYTSEQSAKVRGESLSKGAKALLVKINGTFWLFVIPANLRIDTSLVKSYFKAHQSKIKKFRFATAEELMELTGLVPGSVPPFGNPILPFNLMIDKQLLQEEEIAFNAGSLTDSIFLSTVDYQRVVGGFFADITTAEINKPSR